MKVVIDPAKCEGHAQCAAVSPRVFAIDDEDYGVVREENPGEELWTEVRAAAAACPTLAVIITED